MMNEASYYRKKWFMFKLFPTRTIWRIAVTPAPNAVATANLIAERYPEAEVVVWAESSEGVARSNISFHSTEGVREMLATLVGGGKVQVIVDQSGDKTTFKNLFFTLSESGVYLLAESGRGAARGLVTSLVSSRLGGASLGGDEGNLAAVVASIRFDAQWSAVEKAGHHVYKVRDEMANAILAGSAYHGRSKLLFSVPAGSFESRLSMRTNNADLENSRKPGMIAYPELSLRAYEKVDCYPGQVYRMADLLLPDTFRQIRGHRLGSRTIIDAAQWHALAPESPHTVLAGTYYALDSEVPGHFGHFTSEVLARVWGWAAAKAEYPGLKALISVSLGETALTTWQLELLGAAGIRPDEIHVIDGPVRVDRLVGATPMFSNPKYIHEGATEIWRAVGRALIDYNYGFEKIFISRKSEMDRGCTNSLEVEECFREKGFTIVYPEDFSIAQQLSLFNNAKTVAGFAGSGMFGLMFAQTAKNVIIIGSESYDALNEILFMASAGGDLTYLWCKPRIPMGSEWSLASFLSDYTFDFQKDGALLEELIV